MAFCKDIPSHEKNPDFLSPGYKKVKNPEKCLTRGFCDNLEIKKIFHSGFFRDFKIPIPIPVISVFSGFFDLAHNKKSPGS